jgi:hypothetical protein
MVVVIVAHEHGIGFHAKNAAIFLNVMRVQDDVCALAGSDFKEGLAVPGDLHLALVGLTRRGQGHAEGQDSSD